VREDEIHEGNTYRGPVGEKNRSVFRIRDHGPQGKSVDYTVSGDDLGRCCSMRSFAQWARQRAANRRQQARAEPSAPTVAEIDKTSKPTRAP
jgi:hypothetical protein